MIERLGRRPEAGETVEIDGHVARVLDVDEAHIGELAFSRRPPEEP